MLLTQNETIKKGNNELFVLFTKLTKILENHRAKANIVDCNMDHILAVMHDESEVSIYKERRRNKKSQKKKKRISLTTQNFFFHFFFFLLATQQL